MTGMTMEERIEYARRALTEYRDAKGEPHITDETCQLDSTCISDLIADLYHLGALFDYDPEELHRNAMLHHEAEQAEEEMENDRG